MVSLVRGVEKWNARKLMGEWKSEKIEKNLVFPHVYLDGGVKKWKGGKLICLVENKSERIENVVYIN